MKKKLKFSETIVIASTLFGMFFGAGNLIFPVHLGQLAGFNVSKAALGFIVTAVGIPILGVAAIGITHSDGLQSLADKVGKKYSIFFTSLLTLTIGPFFAIPRCCTTSFTTGVEAILGTSVNTKVALFIFSALFFALVLFFSLRPSKIVTWVGRIINPLFLVTFFILIIVSLLNPSASIASVSPTEAYQDAALINGFIEGYGTMDAIAGLAFGIIVVQSVKSMGIKEDKRVAIEVVKSGIFTALLMALIYILTIVMGAQSLGAFELSANGGIALSQLSEYYLGTGGLFLLACIITLACLKTSIGLVTSCSETFEQMTNGKLKYKVICIAITLFSFVVSNFGLSNIINYSLPMLMFLYPLTMVLIILALGSKLFRNSRYIYVCTIACTFVPAIFDFVKTLPTEVIELLNAQPVIDFGRKIFPFFDIGLGWVVPSLMGLVVGIILHLNMDQENKKELQ